MEKRSLREELQIRRRLPAPAACRDLRLAAGISQERLARELGVHRVTVARWECGTRSPRSGLLLRYVEVLEMLRKEARR